MTDMRYPMILLLLLTQSACMADESLPNCDTRLQPSIAVPPKVSPRAEGQFVGEASIAFVVDTAGSVQYPEIYLG
jgi:hypothetical protein